jgi:hypothetical protein
MRITLMLAMGLCVAVPVTRAQVNKQDKGFDIFGVPGASTAPQSSPYPMRGTVIVALNNSGETVGTFTIDTSPITYSFLRHPDGRIEITDDPSAGTTVQPWAQSVGTFPSGLNDEGVVTGISVDANGRGVGYLQMRQTFADFSEPDANTYFQRATNAFAINNRVEVAGSYSDVNNVAHGFVLRRDGKFVSFDAPDASTSGFWNGTTALSINQNGAVCGYYLDTNYVIHPFLRGKDGNVVEFTVPGAGTSPFTGAYTSRITDDGLVLGFAYTNSFQFFAYVRFPNGQIWNVAMPQIPAGQNFQIVAVSQGGDLLGDFQDAAFATHGFVLEHNGRLQLLDAPGAGSASGQGTVGIDLNDRGEVAGYMIDGANLHHSFVWQSPKEN